MVLGEDVTVLRVAACVYAHLSIGPDRPAEYGRRVVTAHLTTPETARVEDEDPSIVATTVEELRPLYRQMLAIRRMEEAAAKAYSQGKIGGFLHLIIGQEAVCVGAIAVKDEEPLKEDLANLKAALAQVSAVEGFMTAASPGLVPVFQNNRHYPSYEAYVEAIAAAMQPEYEAIVKAGFVLQLDCPDLAMAHHTSFQELSEADFLKRAAFHVEVLNHAVRNVPAEMMRIHICWGNYEGPHDHDIDFAKVAPILVKAKPMALVVEAANPRHAHEWTVWKETKLPDDKILVTGVLDT